MTLRPRGAVVLAVTVVGCLMLAACSSETESDAGGSATTPTAVACPASPQPAAAAAPKGAAPVSLTFAKTIKPGDTSTSAVIAPTGAQIECGKTKVTAHDDIVYSAPTVNGKKTELKLDLQIPDTAGKKPLVVYLPGGGFVLSQKTANLDQRTYVAEQGYVVASIEYRTIGQGATYKTGPADVKSAVRYLRAHADEYGIDTGEVAVWGQSAGGYLAAMTGATNGDKQFDVGDNLDQSSDVQGVVNEFGASDLSKIAADFDQAAQNANYAPGNSLATWVYGPGTKKSVKNPSAEITAANPISYLSGKTPPFLSLHGSADRLISPSQTLLLHNALRSKGIDSTRYVLTGADHGDLSFTGDTAAGKPWGTQETMNHIVDFLAQHLAA
ncbi:alpha/beta hydrolase [Streptomyces sp. SID13031]|uniref:alpha/beta hydrolase n=1 Tax=Streptomyces sp. SID13031 TaxID=2706046 RepID=UPI0013CA4CD3|nr:alpha/beta hydrolase [Streptomyces sp. SID13031]NEA32844.1 alpha/beta hydrolase [Streptomyces sp. SID13031]